MWTLKSPFIALFVFSLSIGNALSAPLHPDFEEPMSKNVYRNMKKLRKCLVKNSHEQSVFNRVVENMNKNASSEELLEACRKGPDSNSSSYAHKGSWLQYAMFNGYGCEITTLSADIAVLLGGNVGVSVLKCMGPSFENYIFLGADVGVSFGAGAAITLSQHSTENSFGDTFIEDTKNNMIIKYGYQTSQAGAGLMVALDRGEFISLAEIDFKDLMTHSNEGPLIQMRYGNGVGIGYLSGDSGGTGIRVLKYFNRASAKEMVRVLKSVIR